MSNAACEAVIQEYCHELKLAAVVQIILTYGAGALAMAAGLMKIQQRELLEAEVTNRHQSTARRLLREACWRLPSRPSTSSIERHWRACHGRS